MTSSKLRRWALWTGAILLALVALGFGALHLATKTLKSKIEAALGPHGQVGSIRVGLSSVEILDLRIKAGKGWPAAEELRAARIVVEPQLSSLVSDNVRISRIQVEDAYLSLLRRRDGKMLILPSLLGNTGKGGEGGPKVHIGGVTLNNAAIEFFDASIRQPAVKQRIEQVEARLGKMAIPDLTGRTPIEVAGVVKGVRRDGRLSIKGDAEFASRDSDIAAQLRGVDLLAFQPYLIKAAETGVKRGTLDLDIKSTVRHNRISAPGSITLSDMELATGGSFMGMPRATVVSMLKDRNGKITAKFVLEGNLNDPKFSLNENFAGLIGASVAEVFGISLEGLAKGVGTVGSDAMKSMGDAVGKLFGK